MSATDTYRVHVEHSRWLSGVVEEAVRRASPDMSAKKVLQYILDNSNLPRARTRDLQP